MKKQELIQLHENIQAGEFFQTNLNPSYTFDNLTKAPSNKFAYKVAEMTAHKSGSRTNNPLIIYSSSGLGKTYLLHAIGNEILKDKPTAKILYISGEDFFEEWVASLQNREKELFCEKFRRLDCLLMDDIQFLDGKNQALLQFAFTLKALLEENKQVVLSIDRAPLQLEWGDFISSRLMSGLIVEITRPNFETRIAILRQKRNSIELDIEDDVLSFIAEKYNSNICDLEGALFRLVAYCRMNGVKPTIEIAKELTTYIGNKTNINTNIRN